MSKFSDFLNNLDTKTIIALNIFLAILVFIPLTLSLSREQTKTIGKAYLPIPTQTFLEPSPTPTPPLITPTGPLEITEVYPFYGKVGDSVIIYGKNFGNQKGKVFFNNVVATNIKFWHNDKIHVLVPKKAGSGLIKVNTAISPYHFIVFSAGGGPAFGGDKKTICEIILEKTKIGVRNCPRFSKVNLVLKTSGDFPEANFTVIPPLVPENLTVLKTTQENNQIFGLELTIPEDLIVFDLISIDDLEKKFSLISAEIYQNQKLLPFFINPLSLKR